MLSRRWSGLAGAVAACVTLAAVPVLAQPTDKRTLFTFSAPVTMPGKTLPAGKYIFRLVDNNTSRRVVQVLDERGTTPYGLFFTLAAERPDPAPTPEVRFMETAAGVPAAIRTWWYPGERLGYEFIYPKEQARRLAANAGQPVLTTQAPTTTVEETNTSDLTRVSSSGEETRVDASAAPVAAAPAGGSQEGTIASSSIAMAAPTIPAPPAATTAPSASTSAGRTELPRTASPVPLVALIGSLALAGAASMRYWRRR